MAIAMHTPLRCTQCGTVELADLYACPECFSVSCSTCLVTLSRKKSDKDKGNQSNSSSNHSSGGTDGIIAAACPTCTKRVEFREVSRISPVSRRVCQDLAEGSGAVALQCLVCGELAFNNRTCPSCCVVYCNICLDKWQAQCAKQEICKPGQTSCANCRSEHNTGDFAHDRFAAKLCRSLSKEQVIGQPKKAKRKITSKRTIGKPKDEGHQGDSLENACPAFLSPRCRLCLIATFVVVLVGFSRTAFSLGVVSISQPNHRHTEGMKVTVYDEPKQCEETEQTSKGKYGSMQCTGAIDASSATGLKDSKSYSSGEGSGKNRRTPTIEEVVQGLSILDALISDKEHGRTDERDWKSFLESPEADRSRRRLTET